ncbi:hypothetical protein V6N12_068417 [Hibiscus sabdariffa]|uniref:Uncharacterized protein n=1 Tax=Hibiscus sabdariffa TaxID=183260 RepID=A0ABR2FPX8_9ROSI
MHACPNLFILLVLKESEAWCMDLKFLRFLTWYTSLPLPNKFEKLESCESNFYWVSLSFFFLPLQVIAEKSSKQEMVDGKMLMELNDYPGSGANNRHTPRPQFGRCVDC